MKVSITIPTMKSKGSIDKQIEDIKNTVTYKDYEIIAPYIRQSASMNRNWCLNNAKGDIIIMMDDDITGFYSGWDKDLIQPLIDNPEKYNIVSARLLLRNGNIAPQLGDDGGKNNDFTKDLNVAIHTQKTMLNITCSACISFLKTDVRFDEGYLGATYEDADFCMEMNKKYPNRKVVINNKCRIIHNMESKGRSSGNGNKRRDNWFHNREFFGKKWGITI